MRERPDLKFRPFSASFNSCLYIFSKVHVGGQIGRLVYLFSFSKNAITAFVRFCASAGASGEPNILFKSL